MISEAAVVFAPPGGPQLEGVLSLPPDATRGVVVCHPHPLHGGDMDNLVVHALAEACVEAGLGALRFNFRGVGGSAGAHDAGRGEQADVRAALDLVQDRLGSVPALAGYSFGAAMAAAVAASGRPLSGVGLVAPPAGAALRQPPEGPLLVVGGDRDHVCSVEALSAWRAALPAASVEILPGVDHFFSTGLAGLRPAVTAWATRIARQH